MGSTGLERFTTSCHPVKDWTDLTLPSIDHTWCDRFVWVQTVHIGLSPPFFQCLAFLPLRRFPLQPEWTHKRDGQTEVECRTLLARRNYSISPLVCVMSAVKLCRWKLGWLPWLSEGQLSVVLGSGGRSSEELRHHNQTAPLSIKGHAFCQPGAYHETCLHTGNSSRELIAWI